MQKVLQLIMRRPHYFLFVIALLSLLKLTLLLTMPLIMLVTLANGLQFGLLASVIVAGVSYFSQSLMMPDAHTEAFVGILAQIVPSLGFAYLLKKTRSFSMTLQAAALFAGVMVLFGAALNVLPSDAQIYDFYHCQLQSTGQALTDDILAGLKVLSHWLSVMWLTAFFSMTLLFLLLADFWYSRLYPGNSICDSMTNLRIDWRFNAVLLSLAMVLFSQSELSLVLEICARLSVFLMLVSGLAVCHWYMRQRGLSLSWFGIFYGTVFLVPQFTIFMVVLSLSDSILDWRSRIKAI